MHGMVLIKAGNDCNAAAFKAEGIQKAAVQPFSGLAPFLAKKDGLLPS